MTKPAPKAAPKPARPSIASMIGKSVGSVSAKMTEAQPGEKVVELALATIRPDPGQPRKYYDKAKTESLSVSIRQQGVVSPIIVRPDPENANGYMIVFGQRRWMGSDLADKKTIPSVIRPYTDKDLPLIRALQASENSQREPLTISEKIAQADELMQWNNVKTTAAIMGEKDLYVTKLKRVGKAGGVVAEAVKEQLCDDLDAYYELAGLQEKNKDAAAEVVAAWRDPDRKRGGWRADVKNATTRLEKPVAEAAPPGDSKPATSAAATAGANDAPAAEHPAKAQAAPPEQKAQHSHSDPNSQNTGGRALGRGAEDDSGGGPEADHPESSQQPAVRRSESGARRPANADAGGEPATLAPPRAGLEATPEPLAGMKATGDVHQALAAKIDGERVLVETDRGTLAFNMNLLKLMENLV